MIFNKESDCHQNLMIFNNDISHYTNISVLNLLIYINLPTEQFLQLLVVFFFSLSFCIFLSILEIS